MGPASIRFPTAIRCLASCRSGHRTRPGFRRATGGASSLSSRPLDPCARGSRPTRHNAIRGRISALYSLFACAYIQGMIDVRAVRQELKLSQAELADKLGLHQTTISRFETGDLPIDRRTELALAALQAEPLRAAG